MKQTIHNIIEPKIIIAAGGTGGHIFPSISTANNIEKQYPQSHILFVGSQHKMEMDLVPKAGYKIIGLDIQGYSRTSFIHNVKLVFKLIKAFIKSYQILKQFKPDVVIGFGGYPSFCVVRVAQWFNIPTIIHEQNSLPGKTNKILAKRATKICVAYNGLEQFFPKDKIVLVGNPIRKDILNYDFNNKKELPTLYKKYNLKSNLKTLLIVGGSQGAYKMNVAIEQTIMSLLALDIQVIWQIGSNYHPSEELKNHPNVKLLPFISNMQEVYHLATVILSRAGAMSVAELAYVAKPTIFVPLPTAAENHQWYNAQYLIEKKAALVIKEKNITTQLVDVLKDLMTDAKKSIK